MNSCVTWASILDSIVQQYSVWSVIENKKLVFEDLGVSLDDVESLPPNVQSKVFQLIAERDPNRHRQLELTEIGSAAKSADAREGLARGLKSNFYDGLEGIALDWFDQEPNIVIRGHLAEHFGRFAHECNPYEDKAMQINDAEPALRDRLLLGAEGTKLFSALKAAETADLFTGLGEHDLGQAIKSAVSISARPKRRILMFSATPLDEGVIRVEQEHRDIKEKIQLLDRKKFELEFVIQQAARTKDILTSILSSNADILHFSGHGESDGLIFEDKNGSAKKVSGDAFAGLMAATRKFDCVILNACFSAELASAFEGHASFVIGCKGSISDDAAIAFSAAFYAAVASGLPYHRSFEVAVQDVQVNTSPEEAKKYVIRRK